MVDVVYRLTGRSVSSSLRTDLPSISAGISIPAMSSRVGAKSMFNTMCGFLQRADSCQPRLTLAEAEVPNHSHGTLFHVRSSDEEGNTDVKLVRHGFALNQAKLANMVAMVGGVDEVGVVQLARLHQHVEHLQIKTQFKTQAAQEKR